MRSRRQLGVRITILALGALIFLSYAIIPEWFRMARKRDLAGALPQQGVAPVVILIRPGPADLGNPTTPQVTVRFHGQLLSAKTVEDIGGLAVDRPARIEYRVGKSGQIYVDRVLPLSALPARSHGASP